MRYYRRLLLVMLLALLALWPASGRAQASPISWQITPGFDGSLRAGAWFPLTLTIANSGPDLQGTLAVRFQNGNGRTFSQSLDLPHSADKRVVIPVLSDVSGNGGSQLLVSLTSGGATLQSQRVDVDLLPNMQLVMGVVSDEGNVLPELSTVQQPADNGFGVSLLHLTPAQLPERSELLQSFDILFVHGTDPSLWSAAQRTALEDWVAQGGQLVAGGDNRVIQGLGALLPATAGASSAPGDVSALRQAGWRIRASAPTELPLLALTPAPGADVLITGAGGQPLVVRASSGTGAALVTAFPLDALRNLGDVGTFWPLVLRVEGHQQPVIQLREQGFFALQQTLEIPALQIPSILGFLGFLVLYIVVVGPLNYLVLRRFDRREWAYVTIPLLVVLFSGAAYVWGTVGRGSSAVLSELSIVQASASGRGQAYSFVALFSPSRHEYDIALDPSALASDLEPDWSRQGSAADTLFAENATEVPNLLIDVGAVRALGVERSVPVPQLETTTNADQTRLTVRNLSDRTFAELLVARADGRAQLIPALAPGAEQTVELTFDRFIQDGMADNGAGVIDRNGVLGQLGTIVVSSANNAAFFGAPGVAQAVPVPAPGVDVTAPAIVPLLPNAGNSLYILGWQAETVTPIQLDGRPTASNGETLYVWPVRKEL